ncbi:axin-1-like isoform X1 [Lampetra fluviatilis]
MSVSEKLQRLDLSHIIENAITRRPPVPGREGKVDVWPEHCNDPGLARANGVKGGGSGDGFGVRMIQPRRMDGDLGYEPEGSASPTPPYVRWAESLPALLEDQDGTSLFRAFLEQEDCVDLLDFWFACSGFRKTDGDKRAKLAKAIYKKFIKDNAGIVLRQIGSITRTGVKECIASKRIDSTMFDRAQEEVQIAMEENAYPAFLRSDVYLAYARSGGESPRCFADPLPAGFMAMKGLDSPLGLQTVKEDEVLSYDSQQTHKRWPEVHCGTRPPGGSSCFSVASPRAVGMRPSEKGKKGYRNPLWPGNPVNPYHMNSGYGRAPASSANDSEQSLSSDAMTDDTMSMTDSSVDGIPPYRLRSCASRDTRQSAKDSGRTEVVHIPRTSRLPKDMVVEPAKFASELISRLERLQRERDAQEALEERLRRVRAEEEGEEGGPVATATCQASTTQVAAGCGGGQMAAVPVSFLSPEPDDDPESILDEHVSRVMKTPGCQSPGHHHGGGGGAGRSRSPDNRPHPSAARPQAALAATKGEAGAAAAGGAAASSASQSHHHRTVYHHHHHHIHHAHAASKAREQLEVEAAQRVYGGGSGGGVNGAAESFPYAAKSRNGAENLPPGITNTLPTSNKSGTLGKKSSKGESGSKAEEAPLEEGPMRVLEEVPDRFRIWQWMVQGEKEAGRHAKTTTTTTSSSGPSSKKGSEATPRAVHAWPAVATGPQRAPAVGTQPSQPFVQDPGMPPLPAPNPLTQLEEARRRLLEEEKRSARVPPRSRQTQETLQRNRSFLRQAGSQNPNSSPSTDLDADRELKAGKKSLCQVEASDSVVVVYYFCGETIPYRTSVRGHVLTLGHFKELLTKKGTYRYYFKKASEDFDCGVVYEEVQDDDAILPIYEEKINGKVERIE